MNKEIELAWAAGFFDGEGCTSIQVAYYNPQTGTKSMQMHISITQNGRSTLDRFWNAVNKVGAVNGPYVRRTSSEVYTYRATGPKVAQVMEQLWPYMSQPKKEQFIAVITRKTGETVPSQGAGFLIRV